MAEHPEPTDRELEILKLLWERGELTVREVWEGLRDALPIVQNTVQAFLRTMEQKGLVEHHTVGRSFVYRAVRPRESTTLSMVSRVLDRVFDGALDQLVESALSARRPSKAELARLRELLQRAEQRGSRGGRG
ncbi:MAG: BlaI/MecI/CopY family transcriptional regulator [Planctomycetota bacterium]